MVIGTCSFGSARRATTAFPQFATLISNQPSSLANVQALLGPYEAMVR